MPAFKSARWKTLKSDWYILLIALVLSFFVWVLYDMSLGYDTFVQYSVEVTSSLAGYDEKAVSNELLVLQGKDDIPYAAIGIRAFVFTQTAAETPFLSDVDPFHITPPPRA